MRSPSFTAYLKLGEPTEANVKLMFREFVPFAYFMRAIINLKERRYFTENSDLLDEVIATIGMDYYEEIQDDIRRGLHSELLQHYPDFQIEEEDADDFDIEFDLDTLDGVLMNFERNLHEIFTRFHMQS